MKAKYVGFKRKQNQHKQLSIGEHRYDHLDTEDTILYAFKDDLWSRLTIELGSSYGDSYNVSFSDDETSYGYTNFDSAQWHFEAFVRSEKLNIVINKKEKFDLKESISFKRGEDPYKQLRLGELKPTVYNYASRGRNIWSVEVPVGFMGIGRELEGEVHFGSMNNGRGGVRRYFSHIEWEEESTWYYDSTMTEKVLDIENWINNNFGELKIDAGDKLDESISFKRGENPHKQLEIGHYKPELPYLDNLNNYGEKITWFVYFPAEFTGLDFEMEAEVIIEQVDDGRGGTNDLPYIEWEPQHHFQINEDEDILRKCDAYIEEHFEEMKDIFYSKK